MNDRRGSRGMTNSWGTRQYSAMPPSTSSPHHPFVGERIDETAIADLPALHRWPDRHNFPGHIAARDPGHRHRQSGHAAPHEDIEIIQAACLDPDEQIARAYLRIRKIAIDDILDPAVPFDHRCLHDL